MDLLLTAGRLSPASRSLLEAEFESAHNGTSADYVLAWALNCSSMDAVEITTAEECEAAARALAVDPTLAKLGLNTGRYAIVDFTVEDDNRNNNRYRPRGCYYENNRLRLNVADNNYGTCGSSYDCFCKKKGEVIAKDNHHRLR